jgi:hypothetical protein
MKEPDVSALFEDNEVGIKLRPEDKKALHNYPSDQMKSKKRSGLSRVIYIRFIIIHISKKLKIL